MKRKFALAGKYVAWLTAFNIAFSSVPGMAVRAEEMMPESVDSMQTEDISVSSVFIITSFPDYKKNTEGQFEKEEIQKKYGNMKKETGTSFEMLELPSSLTIEGHWENVSSDVSDSFTLEGITWTLKSDTGEIYTEESPAGTYTFVPDLDTYLYMQDGSAPVTFEDLKLKEDLKLPAITVETVEAQTDETQSVSENDITLDFASDPDTDFSPETELIFETDFVPETELIFETDFVPETELIILNETVPEEDIFSNIDDSLIGADLTETTATESPETIVTETTETPVTEPTETSVTELTETDTSDLTETESKNETESAAFMTEEIPAPSPVDDDNDPENDLPVPETEDLIVTISVSDGQNSYSYLNSDTNNTVTLHADTPQTSNEAAIIVPCNSELNMQSIAVTFMDASRTTTYSFLPSSDNYQDFRAGTTKDFTYYPDTADSTLSYTIHLTVLKNQHTWGSAATCTTPQLCTVCGIENPDAPVAGHKLSEATCTKPAVCSVCGWTDGELLPHTWAEATCTKPKTCSVCGATSGKKLGHKLGDWETLTSSTETEHGEAIRYCYRDYCDYSETKPLNIIGNPANNAITNLVNGETYTLKETLTFRAIGSGMGNTRPINGDVRYVPSSWKVQNTPGSFMDNYTGSFAITIAGSYTLTVTFQKQVFDDGWQVTDIADSKSITFNVGTLVQGTPVNGTENGIRINPKTNDPTVIIGFVIAIAVAAVALIAAIIFKKKKRS